MRIDSLDGLVDTRLVFVREHINSFAANVAMCGSTSTVTTLDWQLSGNCIAPFRRVF